MPWLALPFNDKRINQVNIKYPVSFIPSLIVLNKNGQILTENGVEDIRKLGDRVFT